jgi:DNA-binding response OmpR family regulator
MKDGKHVIMCVDDDQDMLDSLRIFLEKNNYAVIEANTAEEGVSLYKKEKPDFVLVDLMMEEVDAGTGMVKDLKAIGAQVPIYMLSSMGDTLSVSTPYSELGLSGVFQKPIDFNSLLNILKEKLG